ncbi:MAG: glycine cleavage system aminomethyltransferase GcvT [Propionibacteriaceae bacterium]|nr:glycine cleavage system aminomethyltransferase GcvT [Propionibacteriaceae bacterium]
MDESALVHSPLHEHHERLGATFAPFSGWLMPLEYTGVLAEHRAVREAVGLFDVSHLGKLRVSGPGAAAYLNTRLANDLGRIAPGKAQYTLLGTPDGGVVDDLIAYLFGPDDVLLIPNAANATTVAARLAEGAPTGIRVDNQHHAFAIIAVQGPGSAQVLADAGLPTDMDYMGFEPVERGGVTFTVCRTGYTGEHGYELVVPVAQAGAVWDELASSDAVTPCGLGARDTLRTEMGYPLHGQDISPAISPVQAGLNWAVGWDKPAFDGADAMRALRAQGPARRLRGLQAVGRGIPRPGMVVVDDAGADIGVVTSGTFSPTLRRGIALALVDATYAPGAQVRVQIRDRVEAFDVVKPPFVATNVK